jgi:hypothetical protein
LIADPSQKGFLKFEGLKFLLGAFRFEIDPFTIENVKKEFNFTLKQRPGELKKEHEESETVFRFDLLR